ncbi:phosphatidate phosphatase LPIN3-like isoform X2 [Rana temporaria]|uniref:phosphatidate phosphatase LPIN3-like isoform X2 n=1 Tax=Rana temporaria TaxID=8407 RepID=UPI001AACCD0C|nr:phosphatidate phosphatase LPIN3-like isoform X2 [Rana temporaria]
MSRIIQTNLGYNLTFHEPLSLQRMNYVGQLAGSVLGRVRDLYKGVNPATLSGSIDVIVIRQPDGSFQSSPFHVRFGKLGILRSAEMAVDIEVNGEPVDLQMRLGENGEAFFIQEMEENEEYNPSISPVLHSLDMLSTHDNNDIREAPPAPDSPRFALDTPARRQRWSNRRKRSRGDETPGAQDKDGIAVLPSCDSIYFSFSELPEEISSSKDFHPYPELSSSRSPSPKSDSELEMKILNTSLSENCMEWNWGRLPQVTRTDIASQISQSAPPSPGRELVEISSTASTEPEIHITNEEDVTFHVTLLEGSEDTPSFQVLPDAPSASLTFLPEEALSPDSQEVSLYFPNSDPHPPPPPNQHNSENEADDNMESPMSCVALSLCGGLADSWNIPEDRFQKYKISYSDFCKNPSLIDNPRLVLQINKKYYNWATAAPLVLCMQAFNQELPQGVIDQMTQQRMPPRSRGWWFSWRRRSLPNQPPVSIPKEHVEQNGDDGLNRSEENVEVATEPSAVPEQPCPFRKSLRLTSEQIRSLNLHSGANDVVFSVCTKFQGTCRTRAQIYLWDSTDHIIVSDIDGTVTRSDALGHILPQLGKDWTQPGIVQLYNAIHKNDYKFLYCSARSVGLADITKTFLQGVSEGGYTLPPGPLLLSPSSLFAALHREVVEKTPEHFKIACLSDICQLFPDPSPFHAAFGNRPNDVLAYREVGVPESRIFTVNPKGELTQDLNSGFKSSYSALCDLVNVMFPPLSSHSTSALLSPQFNDFSFWRDPVISISEEELVYIS